MHPAYAAALARESENRRLASLGLARPLLGHFVVALRWRHVMELALAGNAYLTRKEPTARDLFLLLWRLNPCFSRPDGTFPNAAPSAPPPGRLARFFARLGCDQTARRVNVNLTEKQVRQWIDDAYQDQEEPTNSEKSSLSDLSPRLEWFDSIAYDYSQLGYLPEQIFDLPVAWCFQMKRVELIREGKEERLIPPSASLVDGPEQTECAERAEVVQFEAPTPPVVSK